MKYVLIANEGGMAFYTHPEGRMLCLPLIMTHTFLTTNFDGTTVKSIKCGESTNLEFETLGTVRILAASQDAQHTPACLRKFLWSVRNLIQFWLGPKIFEEERKQFQLFSSHENQLRSEEHTS